MPAPRVTSLYVEIAAAALVIAFAYITLSTNGPSLGKSITGSVEGYGGLERPKLVGVDYERMYAVVAAYRRILERAPSEDELQRMQVRLAGEDTFDVAKLETELRESAEYRRLVGLQKNSVYGEIDAVVSETALKNKLADIYTRITGLKIDTVAMDFLYSRYRHSALNDAYITALIQQMMAYSGRSPGGEGAESQTSGQSGQSNQADPNPQAPPAESIAASAGSAPDISSGMSESASSAMWRALGLSEEEARADPDRVAARITALADAGVDTSACSDLYRKKACRLDTAATLDSIRYDEGEPMGSWMPPRNRDNYALEAARRNLPPLEREMGRPSSIGSDLKDVSNENGDMVLW